jgi:hypothetical protein
MGIIGGNKKDDVDVPLGPVSVLVHLDTCISGVQSTVLRSPMDPSFSTVLQLK